MTGPGEDRRTVPLNSRQPMAQGVGRVTDDELALLMLEFDDMALAA